MSRNRTSRVQRTRGAGVNGSTELAPFTFARHSVACERHPSRNEDSIITDEHTGLAAVFDGVGGSAAGEIASQTAAKATRLGWRRALEQIQKGQFSTHARKHKSGRFLEDPGSTYQSANGQSEAFNLCSVLEKLIQEADEQVRTDGAKRAGTDDLATTVAIAALCRQPEIRGYTMAYAHVGDSRIYLLSRDEALRRLTSDDGLLAKLVENQIVNDADAQRIDQAMHVEQLSETEYSYFRLRGGITQALGGPIPPGIHINKVAVFPGDRILLCTDGIHDNLIDEEIEDILRHTARTACARILVEQSIQRSREERDVTIRAKPDDMSAIVMTCRF